MTYIELIQTYGPAVEDDHSVIKAAACNEIPYEEISPYIDIPCDYGDGYYHGVKEGLLQVIILLGNLGLPPTEIFRILSATPVYGCITLDVVTKWYYMLPIHIHKEGK